MSAPDPLSILKDLLQHSYVRERRQGIRLASELLQTNQHRDEVRALLLALMQHEPMTIVRQDAVQALADDETRQVVSPTRTPHPDAQHIVGGRCPNGHNNYYDRRVICRSETGYRHQEIQRDGKTLHEISVACQTCREEFKITVDCEGYR